MKDKTECRRTAEHAAHMAVNGECPWCGEFDEDQTEFMSVEDAERRFG